MYVDRFCVMLGGHVCSSEGLNIDPTSYNDNIKHRPKEWQVLSTVLLRLLGFSVSTAARPQRQLQALFRKAKVRWRSGG